MMFLPKLNFAVVDVRDVAAAHIKAMTTQEASGKELSIALTLLVHYAIFTFPL